MYDENNIPTSLMIIKLKTLKDKLLRYANNNSKCNNNNIMCRFTIKKRFVFQFELATSLCT